MLLQAPGYPCAMNTTSDRVSVRRAVPELVRAQVTGAMGGLMLALDQLLPPASRRYKIVDRGLTRC